VAKKTNKTKNVISKTLISEALSIPSGKSADLIDERQRQQNKHRLMNKVNVRSGIPFLSPNKYKLGTPVASSNGG
jgi:hypothetical protein